MQAKRWGAYKPKKTATAVSIFLVEISGICAKAQGVLAYELLVFGRAFQFSLVARTADNSAVLALITKK